VVLVVLVAIAPVAIRGGTDDFVTSLRVLPIANTRVRMGRGTRTKVATMAGNASEQTAAVTALEAGQVLRVNLLLVVC
jgi:hypothetical protein